MTWLPSHGSILLLAAGAPRYQHVGQVLLFQEPNHRGHWSLVQKIKGSQIGSYFGGELCSIDVDQDGETVLLLIGAPLFYGEQRGGRVFIYQRKQVGTRTLSLGEGLRETASWASLGPNYSESLSMSDHMLIRPLE